MVKRIRPARHYQHPQAPVRALADKAIPYVTRAFKVALKAGKRLFDGEKAAQFIEQGHWREVYTLVDWGHADEAMRHPMALLGDVWLQGGAIGARKINGAFTSRRRVVRYKKEAATTEESRSSRLPAERTAPILDGESLFASLIIEKDQSDLFNYDRFDPVTATHIRAYQDALISQLGVDSRAVIEQTITDALRAGRSPDEIVNQIRAVIGLTPKQAQAVLNFRAMLMEMDAAALDRTLMAGADRAAMRAALAEGKSLVQMQIDAMVARYEENYLTSRATSIAVTESTRAASLGLQDSYQQAVARGAMPAEAVTQYWQISLDEKTCDGCLSVVDQNPDGVPLGATFDSEDGPIDGPPYHPNCRCSVELVTNLDLVPDDSFD